MKGTHKEFLMAKACAMADHSHIPFHDAFGWVGGDGGGGGSAYLAPCPKLDPCLIAALIPMSVLHAGNDKAFSWRNGFGMSAKLLSSLILVVDGLKSGNEHVLLCSTRHLVGLDLLLALGHMYLERQQAIDSSSASKTTKYPDQQGILASPPTVKILVGLELCGALLMLTSLRDIGTILLEIYTLR
eukprot:3151682-Amphidinium_carterae.1